MTSTNGETVTLDRPLLRERARLVPIRDVESARRVADAASKDNHVIIAPTHAMMRGKEVIGYLSLGAMPTVHAWFDSKSGHAADSLKMIETGEAILASNGVQSYCVAVAEESPFTPHMERLGFKPLGSTVLWHKTV